MIDFTVNEPFLLSITVAVLSLFVYIFILQILTLDGEFH